MRVVRRNFLKAAFLSSFSLACFFVAPAAFARERDWQPQRTWVFIVGLLKWEDPENISVFSRC